MVPGPDNGASPLLLLPTLLISKGRAPRKFLPCPGGFPCAGPSPSPSEAQEKTAARSGSPRPLGVPWVVLFSCLPAIPQPRSSWCQDARREIPTCGKRCEAFEHRDVIQGNRFGSLVSQGGIGSPALAAPGWAFKRRVGLFRFQPDAQLLPRGLPRRDRPAGWVPGAGDARGIRPRASSGCERCLSAPQPSSRWAAGREHRVQQSHARPGTAASEPGVFPAAARGAVRLRAVPCRLASPPRRSRLGFNLGSLGRAGGGELQLLRLPKPFLSLSLLAFLYLVTADGNFPAQRRDCRAERSLRCSP